MLLHQVKGALILECKIGADLIVLHCHIDVQSPQMFHIKVQKCADIAVLRRQVLLVRINIEVAVGIVARHLEWKLYISKHLVELVHKVHVTLQCLDTPCHRRIRLARRLQNLV